MPLPDSDTSVGQTFSLEVDGVFTSRLSGASGLKMEREVVERREEGPGGTVTVRQLPGAWRSPEVTLTRGLTSEASFVNWVKASQLGPGDDTGRSGAITAFDPAGAPVKKYRFTAAWPKSLEVITTFDAGDTPTISERLVVVCERIEPD